MELVKGDAEPLDPSALTPAQELTWGSLWDSGFFPKAITASGEGSVVYVLSETSLGRFDISTKKYLGGWPLGAGDPCEDAETPDCQRPWWVGRWGGEEALEADVIDLMNQYGGSSGVGELPGVGCIALHPLRYGDLYGDQNNALVLTINDSFSIFSLEKKKTIFMALLDVDDWRTADETSDQLNNSRSDDAPQHVSKMLYESAYDGKVAAQEGVAGYRGYAKLYFDDFDSDKKHDILVWRKLYKSRLNSDPIKGFRKKGDLLVHYTLIGGEYKKQETKPDVVKGWLTAKNLTWQQGWPSKSECPGEEGKLISEMHDPLLNDPEVLAADVVATSAPVAQASFDCGKASTPVEKLICSSDVLKQQDVQLATAYKAARANADATGQRTLKDSQVAFIKARQAKCQTAECIQAETQRRLQELASEGETLGRGR